MVAALYDGMPRQCAQCGLRFDDDSKYGAHVEWHNVRAAAKTAAEALAGMPPTLYVPKPICG